MRKHAAVSKEELFQKIGDSIDPSELFESILPEVIELLEAFTAMRPVPIALIVNGSQRYVSPDDEMRNFCRRLWVVPGLKDQCTYDHQSRSHSMGLDDGYQTCHAGLTNFTRNLSLGMLGRGVLLAGLRDRPETSQPSQGSDRFNTLVTTNAGAFSPTDISDLSHQKKELENGVEAKTDARVRADCAWLENLSKWLERYINVRMEQSWRQFVMDKAMSRLIHEIAVSAVLSELFTSCLEDLIQPTQMEKRDQAMHLVRSIRYGEFETRYQCLNLLAAMDPSILSGIEVPKYESVDVMQILQELWPTFLAMAELEDTKLYFEGPQGAELSETSLPRISGVPAMLRRVFFNVFSNAIKYSYKSGVQERYVRFRVTPRYDAEGTMFAISASNLGVPFLSENEKRLATHLGFRGKAAIAERPIGSGVGLFEVRRVMELHGGRLRLESEVRKDMGPTLTVIWLIFRVGHNSRRQK